MALRIRFRGLVLALAASSAGAQTVVTEITGIDGEMRANVAAALALKQAESMDQVSVWRLRQMALAAREEARTALEPFGYYSPEIAVRLIEPQSGDAPWRARIEIEPGDPVRVAAVDLSVGEAARDLEAFSEWRADWPLKPGDVLRHSPYQRALGELEQIARAHGFFEASFAERRIRVDPARLEAEIEVDHATGPRYRFGEVDPGEAGFNADLMRALTVIERDQPYSADLLDRQREALVRAGYFEQVVVESVERPEADRVDVRYELTRRPPNTYRVLAGFGTDTGARGQVGWTRHYLSDRGDKLDTALGLQQTDSEFVFRTNYQHPYGGQPGNFLTADVLFKRENDDFRFEDENRLEPVFEAFPGDRLQTQFSAGRLRERQLFDDGFQPLTERLFVTFLNEQFDAFARDSLSLEQATLLRNNPELAQFVETDTNTVAAGGEWTLIRMLGEKFATEGLFAKARVLGSISALGSDTSFLQGSAEARWHWHFLPRHKLLTRGQIGYTLADTSTLNLSIPGDPRELKLDITELPELFRFKAGGDRSVRGYGYEALSTNRNGANHTLVGSIEYEYNFYRDFSVAAFYDIGNAFNDFANPELKRGVGGGLRWYTLIGPVQLDIARALDDDSFRIHFTIGTKLL